MAGAWKLFGMFICLNLVIGVAITAYETSSIHQVSTYEKRPLENLKEGSETYSETQEQELNEETFQYKARDDQLLTYNPINEMSVMQGIWNVFYNAVPLTTFSKFEPRTNLDELMFTMLELVKSIFSLIAGYGAFLVYRHGGGT